MPYTTIDDPSAYFNTVLWTGNGTDNTSITGVGFQPDFLWGKQRNTTRSHRLINSSITTHYLQSNTTDAEASVSGLFDSFDSDGFTIDDASALNQSSGTYVGWNWKCNGGTTSSNTDGSITSTVQANTTAGFSIVTYTGTGSNATVGHGLGKSLDMILVKNRSASGRGWVVWHNALAGNEAIELNITDAKITSATSWNSTVPTSSVFSVGTRVGTNESSETFVAYCFAEIKGYSKFGSFVGNNSSDGAFVYLGFTPRWLMVKNITQSHANHSWIIFDSARETNNPIDTFLEADTNAADVTSGRNVVDFLSNGFKARESYGDFNGGSGHNFVYMAFAEHPFVSSKGVPVTAR